MKLQNQTSRVSFPNFPNMPRVSGWRSQIGMDEPFMVWCCHWCGDETRGNITEVGMCADCIDKHIKLRQRLWGGSWGGRWIYRRVVDGFDMLSIHKELRPKRVGGPSALN